ncbi:hypothetical protein REC12_08200 [Desulfosporosinus sp. PR]|uniref:hypothetical protein n=1 Tax=Candidatus Desulfosporosinus nitrosoreducens TaxID=3401928 RepID=UPI0027F07CDE|nr:hypothetical protein [Desulfosporosinus sp. PR]MDQ7093567.1 hypothetical protein [Desulfosporosinus sp. PR]
MNEGQDDLLPMHSQFHLSEDPEKYPEPAIFSETRTVVFPAMVPAERVQQALTQWIAEIRDWAKGKRYLVGHLKIFVGGQENLWLSSTGRSINLKPSSGWSHWLTDKINLNVTAIIFGPSQEVLTEEAQLRLQAGFKRIESEAGGAEGSIK